MDRLPQAAILQQAGELFGAGYFELAQTPAPHGLDTGEITPLRRWSRAYRRWWQGRLFGDYTGGALWGWVQAASELRTEQYYGQTSRTMLLSPNYSFTWSYAAGELEKKLTQVSPEQAEELRLMDAVMRREETQRWKLHTVHTCGGGNYTHSIPNYGRVLKEGLGGHRRRCEEKLHVARELKQAKKIDFYESLLDVLTGIAAFHERLLEYLRGLHFTQQAKETNRLRLLAAYERVPLEPARDFHEALAAYAYVWMLDGCDNPGRMDTVLQEYYQRDQAAGKITHDEAVALVHEFNLLVSAIPGWSTALGGRDAAGRPAYNDMTQICLEAAHGCIRPSFELRVTPEMPAALWDTALDALACGCGQPALYNEDLYLEALREMHLGIRAEDLVLWNGGGCTETMIHGCSNVGSIEAGLHLALLFEEVMKEALTKAGSFADFLGILKKRIAQTINDVVRQVNIQQQQAAKVRPQPMRSLLIDDCIDAGIEYNAGGSRYNWSVVSVAGLSNVADSLAALEEVVFVNGEMTAAEMLTLLETNFAGREDLRGRLMRCARFGNDDPRVDEIARELAQTVFEEFRLYAPWRGGKFMPSCIMFETYGMYGKMVGATPDGRRAGEPLADSIGPVQGRDRRGPTAMLKSVTKLPLWMAPGTPVLNMRVNPQTLRDPVSRRKMQDLIMTYFQLGGLQIQITALDAAMLQEAAADPTKHPNLIVRIGGYSTWFHSLSPDLQREVIERTEYVV